MDGIFLHKQFCFNYVQISRLQSFEGLYLLEKIGLEDINNKLYLRLEKVTKNFDKLLDSTLNC